MRTRPSGRAVMATSSPRKTFPRDSAASRHRHATNRGSPRTACWGGSDGRPVASRPAGAHGLIAMTTGGSAAVQRGDLNDPVGADPPAQDNLEAALGTASHHATLDVPIVDPSLTIDDALAALRGRAFTSAAVVAVCDGDPLVVWLRSATSWPRRGTRPSPQSWTLKTLAAIGIVALADAALDIGCRLSKSAGSRTRRHGKPSGPDHS